MNVVKIEKYAINTLRDIIISHDKMNEYLNENDKTPSWDGEIFLYSNSDLKVKDILYKIPVQVKGMNNEKLLNRNSITYPVKYENLKNYFNAGGVCYFVIIISDDRKKTALFYNMMTPIKIHSYLEETKNKKGKKTKNIPMTRLKNHDSDELYRLLQQFGHDSKEQGSGELVRKAISLKDMKRIDGIKIARNDLNLIDSFQQVKDGEVCLYGHIEDANIWVPFEYEEQRRMKIGTSVIIPGKISVEDKVYYNTYIVDFLDGKMNKTILSNNVYFDSHGICFEANGTIEELYNDIKFLKHSNSIGRFYINNEFEFVLPHQMDSTVLNKINNYEFLVKAFEYMDIKCTKEISDFDKEDWNAAEILVQLYLRNFQLEEDYIWVFLQWEEKVYPLILCRNDDGELTAENVFIMKSKCVYTDDNGEMYQVPGFIGFKRDVWEKLYDVKKEIILEKIEESDFDIFTMEDFGRLCGELLAAYDTTRNEKYYDIAKFVFDKLLEIIPDNEYLKIYKFQILKRKRELVEEELQELEKIELNTEDKTLICAVNVLLDNKRKAMNILNSMLEEDKELFMDDPIYNLMK